jgi:hypothetical protein
MSGMGGPVGIMQSAIHEAMKLYRIEFKQECFEKVVEAGRYFIQKAAEAAKNKEKA